VPFIPEFGNGTILFRRDGWDDVSKETATTFVFFPPTEPARTNEAIQRDLDS